MVRVLEYESNLFDTILQSCNITFYDFDLTKCDERTFYISISVSANNKKVVGDLIFLIDKQDLYGAISLNEKYNAFRNFFKQQFHYDLLYTDEQTIAKIVCQSSHFKQCFKHYATHYPKHVQQKFFH